MTTTMKAVTYPNLGWETAADLYLPPSFDEGREYPAIVSTHPMGSCKEQTAGNVYAKGLAQEGFVVLVHDASFQGASGGMPRFIEDPAIRVSDIRFAVDYLQSLPYVDAARIGAIGVCGGGAYTVHAGITDHRIKALASITGVNYGRLIREGFADFKPLEFIENMAKMRTAEAQGGARHMVDLLPASIEAARQSGTTDIDVLEATEYYKTACGRQPGSATSQLMSFSLQQRRHGLGRVPERRDPAHPAAAGGDRQQARRLRRLPRRLGNLRPRRVPAQGDRRSRRLVALRPVRQARARGHRHGQGRALLQGDPVMRNVLILGASGQIAQWVVKDLARRQDVAQTLLVRPPPGSWAIRRPTPGA